MAKTRRNGRHDTVTQRTTSQSATPQDNAPQLNAPQDNAPQDNAPSVDDWINWRPPRHPLLLITLLVIFAAWVAFLLWMG